MVGALGVSTVELLQIWNVKKNQIILKRVNSATSWVKKPHSKGLIVLFYFTGVDRIVGTGERMLLLENQ